MTSASRKMLLSYLRGAHEARQPKKAALLAGNKPETEGALKTLNIARDRETNFGVEVDERNSDSES